MTAKRVMTIRKAIALGIGSMVGAGIFALLGEAAALAGSAVWISFLMAGIIALLSGYSFVQTEFSPDDSCLMTIGGGAMLKVWRPRTIRSIDETIAR